MDTKPTEVVQNPRTHYTRVKGHHTCEEQPVQDAWGRWSYPWAAMQPGGIFVVPDPSLAARTRLATAASAVRRRTGQRFATGPAIGEKDGVRWGWWCCRWDGCEIDPTPKTFRQEWQEREKADRLRTRRKRITESRFKPHPMPGAVSELGTFAPEVRQPLEEGDYTGWDKPVAPGEEF